MTANSNLCNVDSSRLAAPECKGPVAPSGPSKKMVRLCSSIRMDRAQPLQHDTVTISQPSPRSYKSYKDRCRPRRKRCILIDALLRYPAARAAFFSFSASSCDTASCRAISQLSTISHKFCKVLQSSAKFCKVLPRASWLWMLLHTRTASRRLLIAPCLPEHAGAYCRLQHDTASVFLSALIGPCRVGELSRDKLTRWNLN